jgi:hypothetical protein
MIQDEFPVTLYVWQQSYTLKGGSVYVVHCISVYYPYHINYQLLLLQITMPPMLHSQASSLSPMAIN